MVKRVWDGVPSTRTKKAKTAHFTAKPKVSKPRDVAYVRGRVTSGPQGPEVKTLDLAAVGQTINGANPYLLSLLATIAQGTNSSSRVGDKILVKGVYMKSNFYLGGTPTPSSAFFHWSIVLDSNPDNTTATVGAIYNNNATNNPQLTVANLERFKVLASGQMPTAINSVSNTGYNVERFIPMDVAVRFPDATGEAVSNGLYFVVTNNSTSVVADQLIDYAIRIRFADI